MEKPKITINDKEIEMPRIKARLWKTIMKFHEERKDIDNQNLVDKYAEIIALAFGVTTDEILDNFGVEDILPIYKEVFGTVVALLTAKLDKKNVESATE